MKRASLALAALLSPPAASAALADSVSLTPAKDTTLYQPVFTEQNSNGAGPSLFVGATSGGLARRALLSFDFASSIPAGSTITAVSLSLNANKSGGTPETIELHRLAASWGEGASNAGDTHDGPGVPAAANDATWVNRFYPNTPWSTPGGDFSPTISASADSSTFGPFTIPSSPQLVADAQSFLDSPDNNFGWILLGDELDGGSATRLDSRESLTPDARPTLIITFSAGPLPGDANANGRIDPDDYALLDRGFAKHLTGFPNGDFNHDGIIDNQDYLLIDQSLFSQAQGFSPGFLEERESQFGTPYVTALLASVPEPALPLFSILYPLSSLHFPRCRR